MASGSASFDNSKRMSSHIASFSPFGKDFCIKRFKTEIQTLGYKHTPNHRTA